MRKEQGPREPEIIPYRLKLDSPSQAGDLIAKADHFGKPCAAIDELSMILVSITPEQAAKQDWKRVINAGVTALLKNRHAGRPKWNEDDERWEKAEFLVKQPLCSFQVVRALMIEAAKDHRYDIVSSSLGRPNGQVEKADAKGLAAQLFSQIRPSDVAEVMQHKHIGAAVAVVENAPAEILTELLKRAATPGEFEKDPKKIDEKFNEDVLVVIASYGKGHVAKQAASIVMQKGSEKVAKIAERGDDSVKDFIRRQIFLDEKLE